MADRSSSSLISAVTGAADGRLSAAAAVAAAAAAADNAAQRSTHTCDQCSKIFSNAKLLAQHQHMFHTEKAFVCEICQKAFRFRSNLAEHRSVHTALKPYVCKFCGKSSRLKGNLTKHILKHHKKEQNAYIGKDDIIIKKGKKSVKDPAAVDFLEKSMIVLTAAGETGNALQDLYPSLKDEDDDDDMNEQRPRSFLLPLGLGNGSVDLRVHSPDTSEGQRILLNIRGDKSDDRLNGLSDEPMLHDEDDDMAVSSSNASPVLLATPPTAIVGAAVSGGGGGGGHSNTTGAVCAAAIAARGHTATATAIGGGLQKTQCPACGKHFRKGSSLQVHMTLNHGLPPPGSVSSSGDDQVEEKGSDCGGSSADTLSRELREMRDILAELRTATRHEQQPRVEQLLSGLDTRVGRLEKQLEMALNSIYTLVQLQTGINSAVTRFREDICEQLKSLRACIVASPAGHH